MPVPSSLPMLIIMHAPRIKLFLLSLQTKLP
jgi:hypothetical protein